MKTKHTPAPWAVTSNANNQLSCFIHGAESELISIVDNEANAKLIAAAPELLQALKHLLNTCNEQLTEDCLENEDVAEALQNAENIIKKATE